MDKGVKAVANEVLAFISTRACLVCEATLEGSGPPLCRGCARDLFRERLVEPVRPAALELLGDEAPLDRIAGIWAAANYRTVVRDAIVRFKFYGQFTVLPLLASLLAQRFRSLGREFSPDLIVPVPTTLLRFLYRGTNLPRSLALILAARFRIPCVSGLRRSPFGGRQVKKSREQRLGLPLGVFRAARTRRLRGRRVLLVDDVLTTGGTVLACARALLRGGASSVGILALAHG